MLVSTLFSLIALAGPARADQAQAWLQAHAPAGARAETVRRDVRDDGDDDEAWDGDDEVSERRGVRRGKPGNLKTRRRWRSEGDACTPNDVSVVENGEVFSILMDRFQLSLDEGDRSQGLRRNSFCKIELDLTAPEGKRLKGFKQVIYGSVVKSRDSRVVLDVQYRIGKRKETKHPFVWRMGDAIQVSDPDAIFAVEVKNKLQSRCRKDEIPYVVRLDLSAMRESVKDSVLAGVDSIDGKFEVALEPVYVPCRGPRR